SFASVASFAANCQIFLLKIWAPIFLPILLPLHVIFLPKVSPTSNKVSRSTRPPTSFCPGEKKVRSNVPAVAMLSPLSAFMKRFVFFASLILAATTVAVAQTQPNLEHGFKHYGSYDFHGLDTVNIMNGNLMMHAPMPLLP